MKAEIIQAFLNKVEQWNYEDVLSEIGIDYDEALQGLILKELLKKTESELIKITLGLT